MQTSFWCLNVRRVIWHAHVDVSHRQRRRIREVCHFLAIPCISMSFLAHFRLELWLCRRLDLVDSIGPATCLSFQPFLSFVNFVVRHCDARLSEYTATANAELVTERIASTTGRKCALHTHDIHHFALGQIQPFHWQGMPSSAPFIHCKGGEDWNERGNRETRCCGRPLPFQECHEQRSLVLQ